MELKEELKAVENAVEGEVKKIEEAVKAAIVSLTGDEKFALRDIELEYLKTQMEIQRLTKVAEPKAKQYQEVVEGLMQKYALSKAEYVFDAAKLAFTKIEKAL